MSVNRVTLLGITGKDPDVRFIESSNTKVATISLATSERAYTSPNGTHIQERTEWHNLVMWRGLADIVEQYVKKGNKLYVEGKLRTRSYTGQDGVKRYVTEIHVDALELLTPKQAGAVQNEPVKTGQGGTDGDTLPF